MDFITQSLDLIPAPAALFDMDLRIVAANPAAWLFYTDVIPDEYDSREKLRQHTSLGDGLGVAKEAGVFARHTRWGWLHVSMLPTECDLTRPDLLLATLHDIDEDASRLDHQRMALSLRVNERGEMALRGMENLLMQAQTVVRSQRAILDNFNLQMSEFFDLHYIQENQQRHAAGP